MDQRGAITRLLSVANDGDPGAMRTVLAMLHDRLRAIAHRQLAREAGGHTLETDGLVDEALVAVEQYADDLHALDEALARLETVNPRCSRIVECRFFAGLSIEETAEMLSLSPATVKRDWVIARAWLNRELQA